ncbi:FAD-binding protein [Luteithermobacter gelatinilyticus]|uniref:FAD-binding protein n=1 Tax=Luteithermobacter gelatinilyticus TaxID=2582913 RepID=UPI001106EACC|nr:FAD-binding protein [Luteithermobacter gelatinilyticus]
MSAAQWEQETDVLVIGSGAGAMTAALVAHDHGARVLVVEKSDLFGGTSAMSGGAIWIPDNHLMRARGEQDSPEAALAYMKEMTRGLVPEEKLLAYITHAPEMLKYLEDHSDVKYQPAPYPDYFPEKPGGREGFRTLEPVPLDGWLLGEDFLKQRPPHVQTLIYGRVAITMAEGRMMLTQAPGAQKLGLKLMAKYWLDLRTRLQSRKDRRLTLGNALTGRLRLSLKRRRVDLLLQTAFTDLIVQNGRVNGAVLNHKGGKLRVRARRGVVLAAGGFEHNQKMREQYLPSPTSAGWSGGNRYNTGDAIRVGLAHGAATGLMEHAWWAPTIPVPGEPTARVLFAERSLPGLVVVNSHGQRFSNEAMPYLESAVSYYEAHEKGGGAVPANIIFDSRFRKQYPLGPLMPGNIQPDRALPKAVREGLLFKAETISELAAQMGVDPDGLMATLEEFNRHARKGEDPAFHRGESYYDQYYGDRQVKPNPCLMPVETPPYYGMKVYPGDIGTKGGLLTDSKARVLDKTGCPIEGLYAIGNCAASVMGAGYPGAGSTLGPAMTFGYLAALDLTTN